MAPGRKLYVCEDCGHEWYEHWTARCRAARIRCPNCGSGWHHMKTKEAREDTADIQGVTPSPHKRISGTGSGHFVNG